MAGWNEWVPGTNMTLSEVLDALKSARVGLDVKDKLYWSFFKVVQEAIKEGNANFDVEMAKGVYNTLKDRLDAGDADMRNISVNWINKNLGKLDQTFMTEEFIAQFVENTQPINAIPPDGGVTNPKIANAAVSQEKTDFLSLGKNIFTGNYRNEYLHPNGGLELLSGTNDSVFRTQIKPSTKYTISKTDSSAFRVGLNNFQNFSNTHSRIIHDGTNVNELTFTPGANEDYLVIFVGASKIPEFMQVEEGEKSEWENYGHKLKTPATPYYATGGDDGSGAYYGIKGDGIADDTQGFRNYLYDLKTKNGGLLRLPRKTYKLTKTIEIPSNVIFDLSGSQVNMGGDYDLSAKIFRGLPAIYPLIVTEIGAKNISLLNFVLQGHLSDFRAQRQVGVGVFDAENVLVNNVDVYRINYSPAMAEGIIAMAYNIATVRARDVIIQNGSYDYGGYECVGIEASENVTLDKIKSGRAWRTSVQVHRDSKNIKLLNSTIHQITDTPDSGAFTMHGEVGVSIDNLLLANNTIRGDFSAPATHDYNAVVQLMDGDIASNIRVIGNNISGNRMGIETAKTNKLLIDRNIIDVSAGYGVRLKAGSVSALVSNNIINTPSEGVRDMYQTGIKLNNVINGALVP